MKRSNIQTIQSIREATRLELQIMLREAKEKSPKICKSLEELRQKLIPTMVELEALGESQLERRPEKRVQLEMVSKIVDVPVNELVLYFMNEVKNRNERSLVEYRLGHVYFYAG